MAASKGADWFTNLFGFPETGDGVASLLTVEQRDGKTYLTSLANEKSYAVGAFSTPSLGELRDTAAAASGGRLTMSTAINDVSVYHALPANRHATFQVASQFNW